MRRFLAVILAAVMVLGCAVVTAAAGSKGGGGGSGGGGGGIVRPTGGGAASTIVSSSANPVTQGEWLYNVNNDTWSYVINGSKYAGTWAFIENPYYNNAAQWFFFDANGIMLTGWVWIKGADGVTRCYYLNPVANGTRGACYMNGKTPDGYSVDATGAWAVNGVVQTK